MITLSKSGNTVTFTFDENSGYLQNGTIDVPVNSLSLILDESDMATFRKSASNDIFVSALVGDFGMSKSELEAWYKENMVGSTGGGGGDITSGEVQTMIDESISGKADTSAVTQSINAAVSGKIDSESAVTNVKVLTVSQQNEVQIAQSKGDSTASTFVGTVYRVGSGLTWNYQTKEFAVDSTTVALKSEVDAALSGKQDTLSAGTNITISGNVISAEGGGKAIEAGRGISVTTGATADTVSFNLPISAGTGNDSLVIGSNNYDVAKRATANGAVALNGTNFYTTYATGINSLAQGMNSRATATASHAEGNSTSATSNYSHSEGQNTLANGEASHAEGYSTKTNNQGEHASGKNNVSHTGSTDADKTLFSVGNGTSASARHNAFEIRQNGDIYLTKDGQDVKLQDQLGGGISSGEVQTMIDSSISGKVDTSAFTAYKASTESRIAEDEEVTAAGLNALNDKFGGLKLMKISQAAYDALTVKDNNVLYIIIN